jgi:hypothetical protein
MDKHENLTRKATGGGAKTQRRFARLARNWSDDLKEVVGIHVLLTRSLFGDNIPRTLLLRVSLAKPTSVPLRS